MKRWEYLTRENCYLSEADLNELGQEGWELLQVTPHRFIFKRCVEDEDVIGEHDTFDKLVMKHINPDFLGFCTEVVPCAKKDEVMEEILPLEDSSIRIDDGEKIRIKKALERTGGNRKVAADLVGLSERTLYRKIREYQL